MGLVVGFRACVDQYSPPSSPSSALMHELQKRWIIAPSELHITKLIGRGSCGEVSKGEWHCTPVAIKKIFRSLLHGNALREFLAETDILMYA
jgi:hypothetical protein